MKQSDDRILTTHAGSLARPDDLVRMMWDWLDGKESDAAKVKARVAEATAEIVQKQAEIGIDVVCDGEMGRESMHYLRDHMEGFGGESKMFRARDIWDYPEVAQQLYEQVESLRHMKTPACTGDGSLFRRRLCRGGWSPDGKLIHSLQMIGGLAAPGPHEETTDRGGWAVIALPVRLPPPTSPTRGRSCKRRSSVSHAASGHPPDRSKPKKGS